MQTHAKSLIPLALLALQSLVAGTVTITDSAPAVAIEDIANFTLVEPATDKVSIDTGNPGQSFTTGSQAGGFLLRGFSFQMTSASDPTYNPINWSIRLVKLTGNNTNTVRSETGHVMSQRWHVDDWVTFTFDNPPVLEANTLYGVDVQVTKITWQQGIPYFRHSKSNVFAGGARYGRNDGDPSTINVLNSSGFDRLFHVDIAHPLNPIPANGAVLLAGNQTLSWTNLPATIGNDVWVDVWFGTDPGNLTKIATAQQNLTSIDVNIPGAGTYHWRVDSYRNGAPEGTPYQTPLIRFDVFDSDGDGLPDDFELAHTDPSSATNLVPGIDIEPDGLTNLQEYERGTDPNVADSDGDGLNDGPETLGAASRPVTDPTKFDSDGDGLSDGVESNSGNFIGSADTGTDPTVADTDSDGLPDGAENHSGVFVSITNTGTHPLLPDTDSDGAGDWYEIAASLTSPFLPGEKPNVPYPLPDPSPTDTGDSNKPVKIYILAGQSNMVGFGKVAGDERGTLNTITRKENKFPNLLDGSGNFLARKDVSYRGVVSAIGNGPLAPGFGKDSNHIGPELGFGQVMGWYHDEAVLVIKASIGNRGLQWDMLPKGTPARPFTNGYTYAGYGESPERWLTTNPKPAPDTWYAGKEFDRFFLAKEDWAPAGASDNTQGTGWVLDNWATEYAAPDKDFAGRDFEIAGFGWFHGFDDANRGDPHTGWYEENMVNLITRLRDYYENRYPGKVASNAPFAIATYAVGGPNMTVNGGRVVQAQINVGGDSGIYPNFAGNVKTMDARPYWRPADQSPDPDGIHYFYNSELQMLVGDALGRAMVEMKNAAAGDGFDTWIGGFPVNGQTGFDQDPDGDGIVNGVEAFFGTRPDQPGAGISQPARNGNLVTFTHPASGTPPVGVAGSYEWSLDLTNWHSSGESSSGTTVTFSTQANTPETGTASVTASLTNPMPASVFVRIVASRD